MVYEGGERRVNPEAGTLLISPMPRDVFEQKGIDSTVLLIARTMRQTDQLRTIYPDEEGIPDIRDIRENRIIIGGSTYSVYQENLSWIKHLKGLVRQIHETRKTLFGICFGHQLIASAFGAEVETGRTIEFDIDSVFLTPEGQGDPLFQSTNPPLVVFQTHGDVVTKLPSGIVSLAQSRNYKNQALAIGPRIRTVQFHPEMDTAQFMELAQLSRERIITDVLDGKEKDFPHYLETLKKGEERVNETVARSGRQILRNFYRIAS